MNHGIVRRSASVLVLASALVSACGSGFTTQQAIAQCDAEKDVRQGLNDDIYKQCVACYEACGNDCAVTSTLPPSYACP